MLHLNEHVVRRTEWHCWWLLALNNTQHIPLFCSVQACSCLFRCNLIMQNMVLQSHKLLCKFSIMCNVCVRVYKCVCLIIDKFQSNTLVHTQMSVSFTYTKLKWNTWNYFPVAFGKWYRKCKLINNPHIIRAVYTKCEM